MLFVSLKYLAVLSAAIFAGAAVYITVVEQPARMGLETRLAALQWAPSYARATWLQAPLAVISFLCGCSLGIAGAGIGWLLAGVLVGLVVPFTLVVVMPTNRRLLTPGRDLGSADTRELLVRWGQLHTVRTVLSLLGLGVYLGLLIVPALPA